jgi:hypothetical protein
MATNPKEAAEAIAAISPSLEFFRCPGRTSDPAVGAFEHTDFFLQLDKPTKNSVMAAKLEGEAAVHKALADAHTKIADVLKSRG